MEKICTPRMLLEDGDSNVLLTTHTGGSECSNHVCLWVTQPQEVIKLLQL